MDCNLQFFRPASRLQQPLLNQNICWLAGWLVVVSNCLYPRIFIHSCKNIPTSDSDSDRLAWWSPSLRSHSIPDFGNTKWDFENLFFYSEVNSSEENWVARCSLLSDCWLRIGVRAMHCRRLAIWALKLACECECECGVDLWDVVCRSTCILPPFLYLQLPELVVATWGKAVHFRRFIHSFIF